jgi:hypothetical protein
MTKMLRVGLCAIVVGLVGQLQAIIRESLGIYG